MPGIVAAVRCPAPGAALWARLLLVGLLLGQLAGCAWLDERQRMLALRPSPTRADQPAAAAALFQPQDQRYALPAAGAAGAVGDQVAIWWLPHANAEAPTLLYLHGTFRNLYHNLTKIDALRNAGYSVLAVDYRGWGDSTAIVPSEASIRADALLAWGEMQRRQGDPRKRVIFGHSLGGAVAVSLASGLRHGSDYAALVLESTFTSLPDLAATAGFWGRIAAATTTLEFDSLSRIAGIDAPLLMLHGSADRTVPVELGRRLHAAAPAGARWIEIPGGSHSRLHSDAPELYQQALRELLDPIKKLPAPPSRATSP